MQQNVSYNSIPNSAASKARTTPKVFTVIGEIFQEFTYFLKKYTAHKDFDRINQE